MALNESKVAQAVFIHEQLLIAITALRGIKTEKKIQKKAALLVAQYHEKRSEHGAYHLIELEFSFS